VIGIPLTPPFVVVRLAATILRDVVFYVDTSDSVIALTLDDGPHRGLTPAVLQTLARYGARATFFLLGERAEAEPELVQRIVEEGHEVGNHTWRDERSAWQPRGRLEQKVAETHRVLSAHGQVRLFRPGAGWPSKTVREVAAAQGYACVLASIYPNDLRVRSDRLVVDDVLRHARRGAIVVLHEGTPERLRVVSVLELVLSELGSRGYRFVTMSELLRLDRAEAGAT
jgi:peptidoglycan/xylan/chitin deacetylase (PgdA/CDA1 family)